MQAPSPSRCSYRFGLFELDLVSRKLLRKGEPVRLQEMPFRVLTILLEHVGEIVTREELRQSLWPEGTYVEFDGSLNAALKKLRFALGDDAENPIFIETITRHGYRFIAPVECERPEEIGAAVAEGVREGPSSKSAKHSSNVHLRFRTWWIAAATAALLLPIAWKYTRKDQTSAPNHRKVIAVLPFSNQGAGPDFDYLRYAIANDLVTDLAYTHAISVRPFASTSRFGSQPADPTGVGKDLRVSHVVAGGFLLDKHNLRVNLELIDVNQDQPIWREEITVPPQQLIALHDKLAERAIKGLLPALNISNASTADLPAPRNQQALDLFVHSVSMPLDPEPNQLAIKKLEESVAIDGRYAPAWAELSWRYYIDSHFGNGGEAAMRKALQASKRRSELDPTQPAVSTTTRTEQGDLNGAYDQAADLLRRWPDNSFWHFEMSYVLRYAGLLSRAGQECDKALAIDPGFNVLRSCAVPFLLDGDYAHAQTYIQLDEHSGFGALLRLMIALRSGDQGAASRELDAVSKSGYVFADLLRLYLGGAPQAELAKAANAVEGDRKSSWDPEELYRNAEILSLCGQSDAALRQLRKAIDGNYCSYPAMENDPLFESIRRRPEFAELNRMATHCQQSFLSHIQPK